MSNSYYQAVYNLVKQIPRGRVTNYGVIASYLGLGSARMVGWALNHAHNLDDVPAHRVVNRKGELSGRLNFATPKLMQELLEHEGVRVVDDKVFNFIEIIWHPNDFDNTVNTI